jgi:uncharacterized protein YbjT (DUF2867 family)
MLLVTGATGLNGSALLSRLSATNVPIRALVRSRDRAAAIANLPNVEIAVGDLAVPETLAAPLTGVERVMLISPSAPNMLEVQSNLIEAARRAGVRHVVKLSGIIPDIHSAFRYARMHGEIEQRLEASGMAFTHLRAGEFMPSYFRQVPNIVGKGLLMLPMAEARIASIDIGDVAEVAALTLTEPGHEGKTYPLTGPAALSMADVAEKLSAITGKPIRYVDVDPEQMRQNQLAAGMPPYATDALFELFAERRNGKEATVSPLVPELLGRPATSFASFAARNAAIFRGEAPAPKI